MFEATQTCGTDPGELLGIVELVVRSSVMCSNMSPRSSAVQRPAAVYLPCRGDTSAWQCDNGKCISKSWKCDGVSDCLDGSDEVDCTCTGNKIQCSDSNTCLDVWEVCDGHKDCESGSDEHNCSMQSCMEHQVQCKNKVCIMESWQCNGINNCGDGSDEESCDFMPLNEGVTRGKVACRRCSDVNGGCSQKCEDVPWGIKCSCHDGWKLHSDGHSCADIDECSVDYSPCHQLCNNSDGSFTCGCITGFDLKDKTMCEVIDVGNVNSISVDWFNAQLYWASSVHKTISVGLTDGRGYIHILEKGIVPDQLIVFPQKRYMYWVNYGKNGNTTLETAGMDGSDRHVISLIPMEQPVGLTLDYITSRLYWISEYKESIETIKTDGSGRFALPDILHKDQTALGISVFEGWFFMADEHHLCSLSRNDPSARRLLLNTNISAFAVLHELQQPAVCMVKIDIASGHIYWLSCEKDKVYVTKHSGSGTKMIYQTTSSIQHLLLNWEQALLYVVEDNHLIRQMNLTGGEVENVLNGTGFTHMSLDIKSHSLLWTSPDYRVFRCLSGTKCIEDRYLCDGVPQCPDRSDEENCWRPTDSCAIRCDRRSRCIPQSFICDGKPDCFDEADEQGCGPKECSSGKFQCANGQCIPYSMHCDGDNDCDDHTDEVNCTISKPVHCQSGEFRCQSGECILEEWKCDDSKDCRDGSDEKLRTLDEEILMSTDKRSMIFSVDYDLMEQKVFWVDLNAESIKWITMDTKTKGTLVKGVKSDCIAVDWVGRNLYWTDGIAGQILATALNASWKGFPEYTVVLDENMDQPRSLVLQPLSGLMYWCEIGAKPQIESAGMDGSRRRVLIAEQLGWPTGLALDLLSWRIYWCDDKLHSIGSARLDGTDIKVLQLQTIQSPFSLTVFEDEIYWSEMKARTVQKINKATGKNFSVLIKRHGQPYGLKVMHKVLQPTTDNPCVKLTCSHMCLISPGLNASCWCPVGLLLSSNLSACVPLKDLAFLLIALSSSVHQVDLGKHNLIDQKTPTRHQIVNLIDVKQISSIDYFIQDRSIIFVVKHGGYLASTKVKDLASKDWKKVVDVDDSVTCIAVDWVTGNIFWISTSKPSIQVATSNGLYKAVVLDQDLYTPSCLALDPSTGLMCYFDAGLESKKYSLKIECANMDGTNRKVLWRRSRTVVGLTFADSGTRLYWADKGSGTIESIKVDGSSYKLVQSGLHSVNMFTIGDGLLFWTTSDDKGAGRVWFSKTGTNENKYFDMNQKVVDLKVYSRPAQQANNGCSSKNGGCDQLCLPNHEGRTCRCSPAYQLVDATMCLEPKCHKDDLRCKDGLKCVPKSKICDKHMDCLDGSDERNCLFEKGLKSVTSPANYRMPTKVMAHPRLHKGTVGTLKTKPPTSKSNLFSEFEEEDNLLENEDFGRNMESRPCNSETCNMRGECIVDAGVIKCSCYPDYSGEFCEKWVKPLAVPLTIGTIAVLLVFAFVAGIFVYLTRRGALQRTSSSASSRILTTRQDTKDMEPLDVQDKESSETFLNDAFDAANTATEQDHV
ncbi:hypothetical protein GDO78_012122 [Eleutherodactylus coqui]|uniref:EGF-like domain-containing protein n=1 Tax=Eleutherodactylus coqui TaxID=57060 RepID=A0A8J6F4M3_ELECQ|nr:hypothetical protein GDO78_012122 [Eleutherodactylus coqui]